MKILGNKSLSSGLGLVITIAMYLYIFSIPLNIYIMYEQGIGNGVISYTTFNTLYWTYCAFLLKKIFKSLKEELPFTSVNYIAIKKLGIVILIYSICEPFGKFIAQNLDEKVNDFVWITNIGVALSGVLLGLIALILAEVVRKGNEMYEDQKLIF